MIKFCVDKNILVDPEPAESSRNVWSIFILFYHLGLAFGTSIFSAKSLTEFVYEFLYMPDVILATFANIRSALISLKLIGLMFNDVYKL
jgi:hypothetical protein